MDLYIQCIPLHRESKWIVYSNISSIGFQLGIRTLMVSDETSGCVTKLESAKSSVNRMRGLVIVF